MGEDMKGRVALDISNFEHGLLKAKGLARSFGISAESSLGIGAFKGMVAGALSVAAVTSGITSLLAKADGIDAMGKRFNVSAESIQAIQFAADQSGASSEAMFMGLKKLTIAIEEARGGNADYIDSLKGLGVSFADIKSKNAEQLFYEIGARINGTSAEATKLTDGIKVFGRSGDQVLGAMRDGFAWVAKSAKEAGVVIENLDVQKLADAHDKIAKLKGQAVSVFARVVASQLDLSSNLSKTLRAAFDLVFRGIKPKPLKPERERGNFADRDGAPSKKAESEKVTPFADWQREARSTAQSEFKGVSFQAPSLTANQSIGAYSSQNPYLQRQLAIDQEMLSLERKALEKLNETAMNTKTMASKTTINIMND